MKYQTYQEVWRELSEEIGAEYRKTWFSEKVVLLHQRWEIILDAYVASDGTDSDTYTRIRAPYVKADNFRFKIYSRGLFSRLGEWLGMQNIKIGDPFFDEKLVIQGAPEEKVKALLANAAIREHIQRESHIDFKVNNIWLLKKVELYTHERGEIKDKQRLKNLLELFALVLDELSRLGSAS